ncbi:hypothetical protein BST81_03205 [Leptolyngbya sp. 'hensonii']|uniref:hybrid sensor histidine kinase/response regulator n=1 Tax=Leptolyngbya sp. 'hensonii' TaxID=1922337 RepID=UPI00094F7813|nr:ATP-binding protein [Leptolyngbya sp. 'hensonii']OLP19855.1 hypothetical protein BST81_03205 [Leptolyngbya sp. 'hensonii']
MSKGNILIADDIPDSLRLLSGILTERGYNVRGVISGSMVLMAASATPPDLILLDIKLPDIDGYEICRQLKENPKTFEVPVIFLSASHEILDKVKAFEFGGVDYITKPFHITEVIIRIENQLLIQRQRKQLQCQNLQLKQEIHERQQAQLLSSQLNQQLQQLNHDLENRVQKSTLQLRQALEFETLLKRITDKVRDSLDENLILRTVVEELVLGLSVEYCATGLYNWGQKVSTILYQYHQSWPSPSRGQVIQMTEYREIYTPLLQGDSFQFCLLDSPFDQVNPVPIAVFVCPMLLPLNEEQPNRTEPTATKGSQKVLGDLWLFRTQDKSFNELEMRLINQVATQCAISLSQARLYQSAQVQVKELVKLNHLKDDFLSTISHELRTPVSNIKLAAELLEINLRDLEIFHTDSSKAAQYLQILHGECQREINLINNLLDLTRLNANLEPLLLSGLNFHIWLPYILEVFVERAEVQQQTLQLDIVGTIPLWMTDRRNLERILTELLTNACRYTPPQETITVVAEAIADTVQISVRNSGVEIAPEDLPYIFDKFYRFPTKDPWKHNGTGLGLALARKLVEQLGGTIRVESAGGQTTFTVALPQGGCASRRHDEGEMW